MRFVIVFIALCLAASALVVFEAASATAAINNRVEQVSLTDSTTVRNSLLAQAEAIVKNDPLHRATWHPGATEGASWIASLRASQTTDPNAQKRYMARSRDFAVRTLKMDPALAQAWLRLALLDEVGIPNSLCVRAECLQHAYKAAPIGDPPFACVRADASLRAGLIKGPDDAPVRNLYASGVRAADLAKCLPSANSGFLFQAALKARRMEAAAKAAQARTNTPQ